MKGDKPKRRTEDLDIAIAIENWQIFDDLCITLLGNHFKRHSKTHKFFYKGEDGHMDFEVDIVPFGGVAVDEKICWPPEGNPIMSVKCFNDVMNAAVPVNIDNKIKVKMAPLHGQFLIKLDTWNDRHCSTDKDAEDMLFILRNYLYIQLLYNGDNTPPDVVTFNDESVDAILWGTQWLAYDISQILSTNHLKFYSDLIARELGKEEKSELIYHFMKYYDNDIDDISKYYPICRSIWNEFYKIFTDEIKNRSRS